MIKQSLTRYHGAKKKIAPWLISLMPEHKCYVEPFGGGASVLLTKRSCKTEIYNDIDSEIFNLFRIVREHTSELSEAIEMTTFSRDELKLAYETEGITCNIEKARRFLVRSHMAISTTSFNINTGFRAFINADDYCSQPFTFYKLKDIVSTIRERLKRTIIENVDAFKLFERYDLPETLWYLDPPYLNSVRGNSSVTKGYKHNLSDMEHLKLLDIAMNLKGLVMISGYENDLYNDTLTGWQKASIQARSDRNLKRIETVWMNFDQMKLF